MNGREKTAIQAASPPCMARHRRTHFRLRRSSVEAHWPPLTPEHGFPSLNHKAPGAPPQLRAQCLFSFLSPKAAQRAGPDMIQKSRGPTRSPCKKDRTKQLKVFLRWHGPHQVLRVEAALPLSQKGSPDFVTHHKHLREFCQGLVFIRKKGYDSTCYGEPLWLRGNNRFRPDEPDVGNANVGRMQHSCTKRVRLFRRARFLFCLFWRFCL